MRQQGTNLMRKQREGNVIIVTHFSNVWQTDAANPEMRKLSKRKQGRQKRCCRVKFSSEMRPVMVQPYDTSSFQ